MKRTGAAATGLKEARRATLEVARTMLANIAVMKEYKKKAPESEINTCMTEFFTGTPSII